MKRFCLTMIFILILMPAVLCSCGEEEPVEKSSFGQVDPMTDGQLLSKDKDISAQEDEGKQNLSYLHAGKPMKTVTQLDVDDLDDDLMKMAAMCDAINMADVEMRQSYDAAGSDYIWHCVHLFVSNCSDRTLGFETVGDTVEADPQTVSEIVHAMFGKLQDIPRLPETDEEYGEGSISHVSISNGMKYRFKRIDRGTSEGEVIRVTRYSDTSLEMEVALTDKDTGEETVSFIYTLRANTRDTSTSALFAYEITGARAADRITTDKLNGTPYLVPEMISYGADTVDKDDPGYDRVVEILKFASFDRHIPGLAELNGMIDEEISSLVQEPSEGGDHLQIMSYPLTTDDYVQVAVTFSTDPSGDTDPDVRCYGFNKKKRRPMDVNDMAQMCGSSADRIMDRVGVLYQRQSGSDTADDVTYKGFVVRRNGSVDVFCTVDAYNEEGGSVKRLVVYNSASGSLRPVLEGEAIPEEETDKFRPVLRHNRKD